MESAQANKQILTNLPPVFLSFELDREPSLSKLISMFFSDFFDWWYIKMPLLLSKYASRVFEVVVDQTSVFLLMKTFFVPWHRDTKPVGYFMGIVMRILYIPIGLIMVSLSFVLAYGSVIAWLIIPLLAVVMLILTPFLG